MKALVLAGGVPQIALIEELKSRGFTVILADYYENPVAKPYADIFYQVSTLDVEAITQVAREENVDFLITACTDQALLTVAKVSETLHLPCYIDYQTALNVTNKAYMKQVFNAHNVSTAKHVILAELDLEAISDMQYPLIVKPVDCNSSKGVKKVENAEELQKAFADAVNFSRTNTAIIEEFIVGTELSVDVYVEEGKAHVLSIGKLDKIADANKFVIFRGWALPVEAEVVKDEIEKTVQQIADAFNLKNTPMLVQMLSDGKRVYVVEFSARTGGGRKFKSIKQISGFDVIKAVVDLTMGKKPHFVRKAPIKKYMVNTSLYCKPGIFDHLEGFDEMLQAGIIDDYLVYKWKGAEFTTVESSGDRVAAFCVTGDTKEEIFEKNRRVIETIKVISDKGEDILRHDLLTDLE